MGRSQMIVLDTHVFLWYALDDPSLPKAFKARLAGEPKSVLVPSISIWEATLLAERGRIQIQSSRPGTAVRRFLRQSKFMEAPLTSEIAVLSRELVFEHEDPADRFIAATAHSLGASLATHDERLRRLPWIRLAY